ncbi:MAG: hypothetical protein ACI8PZ_002921 [Myxococcota bacterium]|jgi:hypothetical protein
MRLSALGVLAACSAAPQERTETTDVGQLVDTGRPAVEASSLRPPADLALSHPPADQGVVVHASGPIGCADPTARAAAPFDTITFPYADDRRYVRMWGAGVMAGDFDDDGHIDVMMLGGASSLYLRQSAGGEFTDTFAQDVVALEPLDEVFGGAAADFDGDGDLDAYITRYRRPNVLLRNDGTGRFEDVTDMHGLGLGEHRSGAAAWADYDRDGDLDLYIAGHGRIIEDGSTAHDFPPGEPSYLFENTGTGFADRSDLLPPELHDGYTFVGGWHDVDDDGWVDLWAINDIGGAQRPCTLVRNLGGGIFVPDDNAAGLDLAVSGMGLGVGDVNRDGTDDFIVPAWNEVKFMLSAGTSGVWINHSRTLEVHGDPDQNQVVGWAAEIADMDNDSDLDIPMLFGFIDTQLSENGAGQPDALFIQDDAGAFSDEAVAWGVADAGYARGLALADLNNDGWLDMAKPDIDGPRLLHMSRCAEQSWLRVSLRMPGMNTRAIGARVEIEAAGRVQYRRIYAGGTGYGSSGPPEAHFGLGDADMVSRITVQWPDGVVTDHRGIEARQILTIRRE